MSGDGVQALVRRVGTQLTLSLGACGAHVLIMDLPLAGRWGQALLKDTNIIANRRGPGEPLDREQVAARSPRMIVQAHVPRVGSYRDRTNHRCWWLDAQSQTRHPQTLAVTWKLVPDPAAPQRGGGWRWTGSSSTCSGSEVRCGGANHSILTAA